ncbi:hypothetical protein FE391_44420 [Nonomuraea sp. KC401]|uniref:hypothetical protein n=1 Tax=unclassified Nonomuraea TaxID=2593643 RepID=UPI0010FDCF70|nr:MULTISPECIES: hypothetical protein [unclassified Nonomuraea]NBF00330.1 hypothetical protein [Nonomuraea sp. K271]TLF51664.1 hypothetical protein FE391_44420 [Nonomuraea sp. KC401]
MSRRKVLLLSPLSALFALLLTTAVPQPAQAYTIFTNVVAQGPSYCVKARAGIDHRRPGLFSLDQGWGTALVFEGDCATVKVIEAEVVVNVERWDVSRNEWVWCAQGINEGTTGTSAWGPTGPSVSAEYLRGVCGNPAWYRAEVTARFRHLDPLTGRYITTGGTLDSGKEWVE